VPHNSQQKYCTVICRTRSAPAVYRFVAPGGRVYVGSRANCRRREREGVRPYNARLRAALTVYPTGAWTFEILQALPVACPDEVRLRACRVNIGTTAQQWLAARDDIERYLRRGQSVNLLVQQKGIAWELLIEDIVKERVPPMAWIDLQEPGTT